MNHLTDLVTLGFAHFRGGGGGAFLLILGGLALVSLFALARGPR